MRRLASLSLAAAALVLPSLAHGMHAGPLELHLVKRADTSTGWTRLTDLEISEWWNMAHCQCNSEIGLEMQLTNPPAGNLGSETVEIWSGTNCADFTTERAMRCKQVGSVRSLEDLHNRQTFVALPSADIMFPNLADSTECPETTATRTLSVLVDEGNDGQTYDEIWNLPDMINVDTQAPLPPTELEVNGVEEGVSLTWTLPSSNAEDINGFQVLCASTLDDSPVLASPSDDPLYHTRLEVCPEGVNPGGADAGVADAGTGVPDAATGVPDAGAPAIDAAPGAADAGPISAGFEGLDARFICATAGSGSTSVRVDLSGATLASGEQVKVKLVTFDKNGNFVVVDGPNPASPQPVHDFWETYSDDGGQAHGGYCSVAVGKTGSRAAAGLGLALLAGGVFLILRKRRGGGPLLVAALLCLSAAAANAQPVLEDGAFDDQEEIDQPSHWAFELKFGPYTPGIDDEPGLTGTPYATMFGNDWSFLTQIEVDRFFLFPRGQLGLAGQIGYMQNSAKSFQEDASGNPLPTRSEDTTAFHMLPTSLSAVYRFTWIADETRVPIVPYAKLGLSYYIWWITKGNGSVSHTDTNGDASGGTLGWQGTVGLSFRADILDPEASKHMRTELGVEHVGFFVEGTYADVSGLGQANKLYVGDLFWAAGVNFEF